MNCQDCNDKWYEYLDETLDVDTQAAMREHLRQCEDCRRALRREEILAKSIRHSLDRAVAGLSLLPETRRTVLQSLASNPVSSNALMRAWRRVMLFPIRTIGAGAALLVGLLLVLALLFHRRAADEPNPESTARTGQGTCVIDVPIQSQTRVFRRQNNTILDGMVAGVSVSHARILHYTER